MLKSLFSNHGILGLNARNLLYIKPFNEQEAIDFADDKLKTKAFLAARGVPSAKLFARIESRAQLRQFDFSTLPNDCALKPNYGFGGEGIIILRGRKNGEFLRQGKYLISDKELREHIEDILDGKFSVNGQNDTAFFEQLLEPDNCFLPFRPAGLPDLRIVVFNLVPVMAMLRIPTAESGGKANIHLGGVGIGIDIAKGVTTFAAQYNKMITELPHGGPVAGIPIPYWEELLLIASKIQQITNIGYLAADITIDKEMGPALLEVNARAGLTVQVANLAPLRQRLERVQGLKVASPEKGVRIAQELFGNKIDRKGSEEKKDEESKITISLHEMVSVIGEGGTTMEISSAINPAQEFSTFSPALIEELQQQKILTKEDAGSEAGTFRVKMKIAGRKIVTVIFVKEGSKEHPIFLGHRDLAGFLIDPEKAKKDTKPAVHKRKVKLDLRSADSTLAEIDRSLLFLRSFRPSNLREEVARLRSDERYNPLFQFPPLHFDTKSALKHLKGITLDDSPFGQLLSEKIGEITKKITLLNARGNAQKFTEISIELYGKPSPSLLQSALQHIERESREKAEYPETEKLSPVTTKEIFEKVLQQYGLHDWSVVLSPNVVADCAVGRQKIIIKDSARFTQLHIDSLIAHEIETHVLTSENAEHQPYELLQRGCAGYIDTQEGLAIYNQSRVLPVGHEKKVLHAKAVLGLEYALKHSFAETRKYLRETLHYSPEKALQKTIDMKRGFLNTEEHGAFTKTIVYFRGYKEIDSFIEKGGDIKQLYIGKVALPSLPLIAKLPGIQQPLLLPNWLIER